MYLQPASDSMSSYLTGYSSIHIPSLFLSLFLSHTLKHACGHIHSYPVNKHTHTHTQSYTRMDCVSLPHSTDSHLLKALSFFSLPDHCPASHSCVKTRRLNQRTLLLPPFPSVRCMCARLLRPSWKWCVVFLRPRYMAQGSGNLPGCYLKDWFGGFFFSMTRQK